jgi:hypothetical protein
MGGKVIPMRALYVSLGILHTKKTGEGWHENGFPANGLVRPWDIQGRASWAEARKTLGYSGVYQFVTTKVRETPSWPGSWANSSPFSLYSHRNAWANVHLLGQPDAVLS